MQSDLSLPYPLHCIICLPRPAFILPGAPMQHKANNAILRGLRFKAIQPSGHVTTLPDAF